MDLFFNSLYQAVLMATDPFFLMLVLAGVLWGCAVGSLPGLTSVIAIGVVVPFTFGMAPIYAIGFLVSINVGVSFGNSIPAILIGLPGTPSAVLTAIDGYALHRQGKTGLALGVTYYASVFGQFISTLLFVALVVPLAYVTYVFLAPELFALYFIGATALVCLTSENIIKGLASSAFGLTLAMVGRDPISAVVRFDIGGLSELRGGLATVPVVIGLLAVSEMFRSMRQRYDWEEGSSQFRAKFPPLSVFRRVTPMVFVGTAIGAIVGAIPGLGGSAASIISYQQSKLWSKHPEEYGRGSIEGIAANESAQAADQAGEMVPTFGLGIPGSDTMVVLLGALLMHGFVPGPLLIRESPQFFYAAIAGLLTATVMLAIVGWSIARVILKLVTFDRSLVLIGALGMTMMGAYAMERSIFQVSLLIGFGVVGYFMIRYGYSTAGAAIGFVLGSGLETNLRSGLLLYGGDVLTFVARPWTAAILILALLLLVYGVRSTLKLARAEARVRQEALERHLGQADPAAPA